MARTKSRKEHYVDNKKLFEEMKKFKELCKEAEETGDERPPVSHYIGECFLKIANGLSYKPNFVNYTYKDEMVSDGIENCLQYFYNFNPEKSNNPFAYFTQIIYYAFIRRIQKEKKYLYTKYKASENVNLFGQTAEKSGNDIPFDNKIKYNEWSEEYMNDFIENFEENKRKKKRKTVAPLDKFIAEQ